MINRTLKYPLWVGLAVFILILVSILGMLRINLDVNFNDYFAHDDAQFIALQQMQQRFAQRNSLLLLLVSQQDWRRSGFVVGRSCYPLEHLQSHAGGPTRYAHIKTMP